MADSLQVLAVSDLSIGDVTRACDRPQMDRSSDIDRLAELAIPSAPTTSTETFVAVAVPVATTPTAGPVAAPVEPPAEDDPFDYGMDALPDQEAVAQAFADLDRLTLQAERATVARKKAEEQLQKCKQAEEQLLNRDIPELLAKMHLDECTTASGIQVKVKREIKASLPGHERVEARMGAFRWLVSNGHGGVIKNQVSVSLERGQDDRADDLVVELRGKGFEVEAKKDVHAGTLGALVRELVAEGKIVPRDLFNLFDMRIAKLTRKD